jgi:regulator of replication initiation timing
MKYEHREKDGVLQIKVGRLWVNLDEHLEKQESEIQRARDENAQLYAENKKLRERPAVKLAPTVEELEEDEEWEEVSTFSGNRIRYTTSKNANSNKPVISSEPPKWGEPRVRGGSYTGKVTFSIDPATVDEKTQRILYGYPTGDLNQW